MTSQLREQLESFHRFPGPFEFKLIGVHTEGFEQAVRRACEARFAGVSYQLTKRVTKSGRHQSISLTLVVPDAQAVVDFYEVLGQVEGLHMLL